jgi:hypothetical protein
MDTSDGVSMKLSNFYLLLSALMFPVNTFLTVFFAAVSTILFLFGKDLEA